MNQFQIIESCHVSFGEFRFFGALEPENVMEDEKPSGSDFITESSSNSDALSERKNEACVDHGRQHGTITKATSESDNAAESSKSTSHIDHSSDS